MGLLGEKQKEHSREQKKWEAAESFGIRRVNKKIEGKTESSGERRIGGMKIEEFSMNG